MRDFSTSAIGEPEATSLSTEKAPSIADRDFSEISEKIEKSVCTETGQRHRNRTERNL